MYWCSLCVNNPHSKHLFDTCPSISLDVHLIQTVHSSFCRLFNKVTEFNHLISQLQFDSCLYYYFCYINLALINYNFSLILFIIFSIIMVTKKTLHIPTKLASSVLKPKQVFVGMIISSLCHFFSWALFKGSIKFHFFLVFLTFTLLLDGRLGNSFVPVVIFIKFLIVLIDFLISFCENTIPFIKTNCIFYESGLSD